MKINCLSCGHKLDLDDMYEDYTGQIKCYVCDATLEVILDDGKAKSIKLARSQVDQTNLNEVARVGAEGRCYA